MEWQLQDARTNPQGWCLRRAMRGCRLSRCAASAAVVLSARDYYALRAGRPTLVDDLLGGPAWCDHHSLMR